MFKKKEKQDPRKRFYEWRFKKTGARYGTPILCEDACEFWLLAHATNFVVTRAKTEPVSEETKLVIAVSLTEEIVYVYGEAGVKARVAVMEGETEVYGEWVFYRRS